MSGLSREEGWDVYAESKSAGWPATWSPPTKGESRSPTFAAASCPFSQEMRGSPPGKTIIVIAHGIVIRVVLLSLLDDLEPADFDRIAIDFASINDLRWDGQGGERTR